MTRTERITLALVGLLVTSAESAVAAAADPYQQFLDRLDKRSRSAVPQAVAAYKRSFGPGAAVQARDAAFIRFRTFYYGVDLTSVRGLAATELKVNGLTIKTSEGDPYQAEDPDFLRATFAPYVSAPILRFLDIRRQEMREGYADDGGLLISFDRLGERVATWDTYRTTYPGSPLAADAKAHEQQYLWTFLNGMDNSPLFDWTSHKLRPEVQGAYEGFYKRHPRSRHVGVVSGYLQLIKGCGYRDCPQRRHYLSAQGLGASPETLPLSR